MMNQLSFKIPLVCLNKWLYQRDFSNNKTRAKRGFQFSAGCKGQLSHFLVEYLNAIEKFYDLPQLLLLLFALYDIYFFFFRSAIR